MKNIYKILLFLAIAVLIFAGFYGYRQWRLSQFEKATNVELVNGLLPESVSKDDVDYLVPPNQIYDVGLTETDLPAIDNPKFVSSSEVDEVLADGVPGIVVEVNGDHRFYSYQILNWHRVVNDDFNGKKLAITLCPLCRSAIVFERDFQGAELKLRASNMVYNNNMLLRDSSSDSLWLQSRGLAISGSKLGSELNTYPSEVMFWSKFKELYPDGKALSTDTGAVRDYTRHPFGQYDIADVVYFPMNKLDDRIGAKWIVNGVDSAGEQMAFPATVMMGFGVAQESVGGQNIVGIYDFDLGFTRVFSRQVDGQDLTFKYDFDKKKITDDQTSSVWNAAGEAISGDLKGKKLMQLYAPESFWMCWSANFPNTKIIQMETAD